MGKSKRMKKVTAGRLVHAVIYTQPMASDLPPIRRAKTKCSSLARAKLNFKFCYEKLQLMIAANFNRNDLFITLTYSDDFLPTVRAEADKKLSKFLLQLRNARKKSGDTIKYIRTTHELTDTNETRLHHHIIVNASNLKQDYELIRSLWTHGDNIEITQINNSEYYQHDDFLELARYLTREAQPGCAGKVANKRSWSSSRNLKKPIIQSELVDDNLTIEPPLGSFILDSDETRNEFGTYKYIKYILPEQKKVLTPQKNPRKYEE